MAIEKQMFEKTQERKVEKTLVNPQDIFEINPEKKETEIPVVYVMGWGKMWKPFFKNCFPVLGKERRAITFNFPRRLKIEKSADENISTEHLQKALCILDVLKQKQAKQADFIAHSEGGLDVIIAASIEPGKFRNLVLLNSAGLIGKDSFGELFKRFKAELANTDEKKVQKILEEKVIDSKKDLVMPGLSFLLRNPAMAYREIKAIAKADIYELLKEVKRHGIRIALVTGVEDKLFPTERLQSRYGEEQKKIGEEMGIRRGAFSSDEEHKESLKEAEIFNQLFDGVYTIRGAHDDTSGLSILEPGKLPEALKIILDDLERKREMENLRGSLAADEKGNHPRHTF